MTFIFVRLGYLMIQIVHIFYLIYPAKPFVIIPLAYMVNYPLSRRNIVYTNQETKEFFQVEIILNILVLSFRFT